ncbi:hypothetical protein Y039_1362 [Burkholderia pseudomallei MSHR1029]|nr:hypothetical protein Y039_1362 [Burkholderia pseudomallei MSHR1029]
MQICGGPVGYNVKGTTVQDTLTGKPVVIEVAPAITDVKGFIWGIATAADWYGIHIPDEYPERRDADGVLIRSARSKNVIQEKIAAAKNWADHPLSKEVQLGPDPNEPIPARREELSGEAFKAWQDENWQRLKEASARIIRESRQQESPAKRARRPRKSP